MEGNRLSELIKCINLQEEVGLRKFSHHQGFWKPNPLLNYTFKEKERKSERYWTMPWSHLRVNLSHKSHARQFSWKRVRRRCHNSHKDPVTATQTPYMSWDGYVPLNLAKFVFRGSYGTGFYVGLYYFGYFQKRLTYLRNRSVFG